jgi:hypothetical protein
MAWTRKIIYQGYVCYDTCLICPEWVLGQCRHAASQPRGGDGSGER